MAAPSIPPLPSPRADFHSQLPGPQFELYSESKAPLPVHAQRINSLFASDKEFASCRVKYRGHTMCEGAAGGGEGEGPAAAHAAREGSTGVWVGAGHTGGVHLEDHLKVCDAGRVEAQQRLVERLRSLPSRKGGSRCGELAEERRLRMQRARKVKALDTDV